METLSAVLVSAGASAGRQARRCPVAPHFLPSLRATSRKFAITHVSVCVWQPLNGHLHQHCVAINPITWAPTQSSVWYRGPGRSCQILRNRETQQATADFPILEMGINNSAAVLFSCSLHSTSGCCKWTNISHSTPSQAAALTSHISVCRISRKNTVLRTFTSYSSRGKHYNRPRFIFSFKCLLVLSIELGAVLALYLVQFRQGHKS